MVGVSRRALRPAQPPPTCSDPPPGPPPERPPSWHPASHPSLRGCHPSVGGHGGRADGSARSGDAAAHLNTSPEDDGGAAASTRSLSDAALAARPRGGSSTTKRSCRAHHERRVVEVARGRCRRRAATASKRRPLTCTPGRLHQRQPVSGAPSGVRLSTARKSRSRERRGLAPLAGARGWRRSGSRGARGLLRCRRCGTTG